VDWIVEHPVQQCQGCGASLQDVSVERVIARQVYDLPPLQLEVSEHQVEVKCCPGCGQENQGQFPSEVRHPVQYGPGIKGMMVYLMEGQLLPSQRSVELLSDVLAQPHKFYPIAK
jgi:transposase